MKVMLINSSSHPHGCTQAALEQIARTLNGEGIETEIIQIGNRALQDCIACGRCGELGKCVFDDIVNEISEKAKTCDGFVFGSPVYYAHPTARLQAVMDRCFYSAGRNFAFKPAAAVFSARRAGSVASMDVINKYFTINSMPIVSSTYWNHVFGARQEEALMDEEGIATMTNIGKNMAWLLKCIELGRQNGLPRPENEKKLTNFFR